MKNNLPSLEKDCYRLMNGVKLHKENPSTFEIPCDETKLALEKGNLVKLNFEIKTIDENGNEKLNGERMWVIVTDRHEDWFTGFLDNQPYCTDAIKPGLVVHFNSKHIIDIDDFKVDLEEEKYKEYQNELKRVTSQ